MKYRKKKKGLKLELNSKQQKIMYYVLKPKAIKVLELKMKGKTLKYIADMYGVSITSVWKLIDRSIKKINKAYLKAKLSKDILSI
ncbi:MAG: helix-turn-helix transcriptional regulator [Minisyncoccia bacterium]